MMELFSNRSSKVARQRYSRLDFEDLCNKNIISVKDNIVLTKWRPLYRLIIFKLSEGNKIRTNVIIIIIILLLLLLYIFFCFVSSLVVEQLMRTARKHLTQYYVFMVGQLRNERNFVT